MSRTALVAVVLAFPMLKVAWTLGGSTAASEVFLTMGAKSWPDALTGILLTDALLASVLAVLACQQFPARFRKAPAQGWLTTGRLAVLALTVPLAVGIIVGTLHGPGWGAATALTAYILRLGRVVTYGDQAADWRRKAATATLVLSVCVAAALPLVALASCLNGRSWAPVLACDTNTGDGTRRDRVSELSRDGTGVVAWDISGNETVNGSRCAPSEDQQIRPPWWRT